MAVYFDTGLFLKLYLNEPDSPKALSLAARLTSPICFTPFLRAELVNALRCKEGRGEMTGGRRHESFGRPQRGHPLRVCCAS